MRKVMLCLGKNGYWGAECPILPSCISQGKTKTEARANIREAIEGCEAALEVIEADPKFVEMMKRSDEDIRAGRVVRQDEVERQLRRRKKRR